MGDGKGGEKGSNGRERKGGEGKPLPPSKNSGYGLGTASPVATPLFE